MSRYTYKPENLQEILPFEQIYNHLNDGNFCSRIVFDPKEDDCFNNCPPYVVINIDSTDETLFFEIPEIIAYYARTHAGYTWKGRKQIEEEGKRKLRDQLKSLLK